MNKNLISLDELKRIAIEKGLNKYIKKYGYANDKKHKYYIININDKKIKFGSIDHYDYLTFDKDIKEIKRKNFRSRFKKLYDKFKNDINSKILYSYELLW